MLLLTPALSDVVSHWDNLHEGLQTSVQEFYGLLEEALARRSIPGAQVSRVEHQEAGILSSNREYLRVTREGLYFDICAAPFGTGFFMSWWLTEPKNELSALVRLGVFGALFIGELMLVSALGLFLGTFLYSGLILGMVFAIATGALPSPELEAVVRSVPVLSWFYASFVKPVTFYRIDTTLMFQQAVHQAVLEVVDATTTAKGIRALNDQERKPIMRDFFTRKH